MPSAIFRVASGLLVVASLTQQAGAAKPPKVPAGKWAVDYQVEDCTLTRDGPSGEAGIAIRVKPLDDRVGMMVYGPWRTPEVDRFEAKLDPADGELEIARPALAERKPGSRIGFVKLDLSRAELARLGRASAITVSGPADFAVHSRLTGIPKALDALRACEVFLAGRWGIGAAEMASWAQPARPTADLDRLFWSEDKRKYGMLRSGAVRGVLDIDATGRMTACRLVQSSRISWVDAQFCRILREHARFEPARNAAGEAVPGKVITPAVTSMPYR